MIILPADMILRTGRSYNAGKTGCCWMNTGHRRTIVERGNKWKLRFDVPVAIRNGAGHVMSRDRINRCDVESSCPSTISVTARLFPPNLNEFISIWMNISLNSHLIWLFFFLQVMDLVGQSLALGLWFMRFNQRLESERWCLSLDIASIVSNQCSVSHGNHDCNVINTRWQKSVIYYFKNWTIMSWKPKIRINFDLLSKVLIHFDHFCFLNLEKFDLKTQKSKIWPILSEENQNLSKFDKAWP